MKNPPDSGGFFYFEIESHYIGTKEGCMKLIDELKEEYGTTKVVKYKAY